MATQTAPATAQLTTATEETAELRPCACRFVLVDGKPSGCKRTTKRTFAPGHDAQLKSRLIRAEVAGSSVAFADKPDQTVSVAEVAGSHGFGYLVTAGVVRARRQQQEKAQRKAERDAVREANRTTREAAKADTKAKREAAKSAGSSPKMVQAKVGRWVVSGTVARNGDLSYKTKAGVAKVAKKGSYTLV